MGDAEVGQDKKRDRAFPYFCISLLFLVVLYAEYLGDKIDIDAHFVKVDVDRSLRNTANAEKSSKTPSSPGAPPPVVNLSLEEAKQLLEINGLTSDEVTRLLLNTSPYLPKAKILWVDDHPSNNHYQRLALASLGIFCDDFTNNHDGLVAARMAHYDVVVSDVQRDNEEEDGIDFLGELRNEHGYQQTKFFFYTTAKKDDVFNVATKRNIPLDNVDATTNPAYLLKGLLSAIPHEQPFHVGKLRAIFQRISRLIHN